MVFIWGNKGYYDFLGYIIMECQSCGTTCPFAVEQVKKKFTVYFIPTFSYSQKQYLVCTTCQASFEVPNELRPEIESKIMTQSELSDLIRSIHEKSSLATDEIQKQLEEPEIIPIKREAKIKGFECAECRHSIDENAKYCPGCGIEFTKKPWLRNRVH